MGWRFRRTLNVGGFRSTISKQGLGGSWGLGGVLRFGVSPDGRRYISVRIPRTGVSWVKYYGRGSVSAGASAQGANQQPVVSPPPGQASQNQIPPASTQPWWKQPWWKQKGP